MKAWWALLLLWGCGGVETPDPVLPPPLQGEPTEWADVVGAYYGVDLSFARVVVGQAEVDANCGRSGLYGCVTTRGQIWVNVDNCLPISHELIHLADFVMGGDGDPTHTRQDFSLIGEWCF
jgi:hypothetical protein